MSNRASSISAVVLAKDEKDNIVRCVKSLQWCDEIMLLDDSLDETVRLAKATVGGKLVVLKTKLTDFSLMRNLALTKATHEWVLFVDADEEVTRALENEIKEKIRYSQVDGFIVTRHDYFLGRWLKYGETSKVKLLKLGKKTAGTWVRQVHETWNIDGKTQELTSPLLHYPHPTVGEFLSRISRWTDFDAREFFAQGKRVSWWQIVVYPKAKFMLNYFLRQGFRDGMPGLILALMMSFHSFLTRAKLYQMQKENS